MELSGYLRILRQRWWLLVLPGVAAVVVAVLTLPEQDAPTGPAVTSYSASATLIAAPVTVADTAPVSLSVVALYTTIGEIPQRAAQQLDYTGEPQVLAAMIMATPNADTATLTISGSDPDGQAVAERVNAFADATVSYFQDQQLQQTRARIEELRRQMGQTSTQLERLRARQDPGPVIEAKVSALQSQYGTQFAEVSALSSNAGRSDLLAVLEPAVAIPQTTQAFAAPSNPVARLGIASLLGLVLGAALALVVERLDSRMRTREEVEDSIGLPVLAEIPALPRKQRVGVLSASRPASVVAEAFRALRSSVLFMSPGMADLNARPGRKSSSLVVLVTSALPGEGKSTTVANLAAVMAEAGRRVLVLSLDLRNPRLHECFGMDNGTGLSDLLAAERGKQLREVVRETDVPGVAIATSGQHLYRPGALLASAGPMIATARTLADVVLIDTPPMLSAADALDLARYADQTLLVTRLNRTTRSEAAECQRHFSRLGVSALGTVLIGSRAAGVRYGYAVSGHANATTTYDVEALAGQRSAQGRLDVEGEEMT